MSQRSGKFKCKNVPIVSKKPLFLVAMLFEELVNWGISACEELLLLLLLEACCHMENKSKLFVSLCRSFWCSGLELPLSACSVVNCFYLLSGLSLCISLHRILWTFVLFLNFFACHLTKDYKNLQAHFELFLYFTIYIFQNVTKLQQNVTEL